MGWLFILLASMFEMVGVIGLKVASKHKTWKNKLLYIGGFGTSVTMLYQAFSYLPSSVAYAMWVGIGTAGAVIVNMILFGESKSISRIMSIAAIIVGVVGLRALS